ncbi:MAG: glycoside hydrolase family 9 protein [Suilimivivens sp.]
MRKQIVLPVLLCMMIFAGCSRPETKEQEQEKNTVDFTGMEEEADLSYEVPVSIPGILIDQLGYMTGSTKVAVFKGEEIPEQFHVVDEETGEIMFTGFPEERRNNGKTSEYISYGDFSVLTESGTYYIEAPVLGRSYSFVIEENVYDTLFKEACKQYYYNRCGMTLTSQYAGENAHNACHTGKAALFEDISVSLDVTGGWHQDEKGQKDVATASKTISIMMLAYELYGESFGDDTGIPESGNNIPDILDEIRYEVEWLLKMQDQETGAVYEGLSIYQQSGNNLGKTADIYVEPASPEAEKAFAMAIAKFSYIYQYYDTEYATSCLKAADRAFKHAELDEKNKKDEWGFAAAAELYRAAGQSSYQKYVTEYLTDEKSWEKINEITLLGCVTYISTKQSVNINLCEKIMKMLMDQAENISASARNSAFLTTGDILNEDRDKLLVDVMYLTVVNHIISNHEYETMIENYLHYILGRNDMAVSCIDGVGENTYADVVGSPGIMKQFEADSKLIFMLSEIVKP